MSLLDELNRNDQFKRLASTVNKQRKQIKILLEQKQKLEEQLSLAMQEISLKEKKLKAMLVKPTTTRKRKPKATIKKQASETLDVRNEDADT
jgi:phosphoenolpyruvate synthase/pyruvate phosphate dikinase